MIKKKKYLSFLLTVTMLAALFAFPIGASAAQAAPVAAIMGFSMGSNTISLGQSVVFTVNTTAGANNVVVVYDGKTAVATQDTMVTGANKRWTVSFAPVKDQVVQLIVSASSDITNAATLQIPISVNGGTSIISPATPNTPAVTRPTTPASGVSINEITETSSGKTVTLTVKTNAAANNVWAVYDSNKYPQGTLVSTDGDVKTWSIQFNPSQIQVVTVSANTAYKTNGATNKDYTIEFTSSLTPPATATITSASLANSSIYEGNSTTLTIRTNADAQYVWVEYDGIRDDASLRSETRSSKTWSVSVSPEDSGRIYVYANTYDSDDGAANRTVNVTVRSNYYNNNNYYGYGSGQIYSASASINYSANTFSLNVTTSPYVRYLRFYSSNTSNYVTVTNYYQDSNGNYVWSYSGNAYATTFSSSTLNIQASESSDYYGSYTSSYQVSLSGYDASYGGSANISSFYPASGSYNLVPATTNMFYVITGTNVTSVTINTPNGSYPSYSPWNWNYNGSSKEWHIEVPNTVAGTYTAYAFVNNTSQSTSSSITITTN